MLTKDKFYTKVNKNGAIPKFAPELGHCWLWIGAARNRKKFPNTYGCLKVEGALLDAHVVSYLIEYKVIPEGKIITHKCDVKLCVRPTHLEAGTYSQNRIDALTRGLAKIAPYSTRNNKQRLWKFSGKEHTLKDWSIELNVSYDLLRRRLYHGWSVKRAFTSKVDKRYSRTKTLPDSSMVECLAVNKDVAGSNPVPAAGNTLQAN
jgi:hypothetical protein